VVAPRSGAVRRCPAWCGSWPASTDDALLVGSRAFDDAAVYRVSRRPRDGVARPTSSRPLVDDPADFGAIAAANACSDVFAMGGRVTTRAEHLGLPRAPARRGHRGVLRAAAETVGRPAARRRRPHHPQRGADLRARRAGPGPPRPHLHQGRRRAGRRARAVEAARHGASCWPAAPTREGRRRSRDARRSTGPRRGAAGDGRARCTRSPTSPASAWPATRGRWRSVGVAAVLDTERCRSTTGALPRPSGACAPGATSATASTCAATSLSEAPDALDALCFDPRPRAAARRGAPDWSGRGGRPASPSIGRSRPANPVSTGLTARLELVRRAVADGSAPAGRFLAGPSA
jgi:selenide,water dikinase